MKEGDRDNKESLCYLNVAVEQRGRVHILEGSEDLVHDVLLVDLFQDVGSDDSVQVGLHVLKNKVDVAVVLSLQNIQQPGK